MNIPTDPMMRARLEARFHSKVDRSAGPDACWPYMGGRTRLGYGRFGVHPNTENAHRVAWTLAAGNLIPAGRVVKHECDNPPCCNPAHLRLGTTGDNIKDAGSRGRMANGERHWKSRLTEEQAVEIHRRLAKGESQRSIADSYGVSRGSIQSIASGRGWRHVIARHESEAA